MRKIRAFLCEILAQAQNCKKMQEKENIWRWRVGHYRIIAELKVKEPLIYIIEISTREDAYK